MSTVRILALDTTTEACSVALAVGDSVLERWERLPRGHSARILPMIDELLAESQLSIEQLDALAFCRGPGSFTGVRICAGVVQGLAFAADRPVVPVSTLQALAEGARRRDGAENVVAGIDARMNQVYWGAFGLDAAGTMRAVESECVADPDSVPVPSSETWVGVGTAFVAYGEQLRTRLGSRLGRVDGERLPRASDCLPAARAAVAAAETVTAAEAIPVYLRDQVAKVKA